jgi:hypothetical protein
MTNKNQPFTAELAWTLIEQMGWSKRADYKKIAATFFKKLGKRGMEQLSDFVGARVGFLGGAVSMYEADPAEGGSGGRSLEVGSDDGFSDLRYHIVGLGQAEYDKCLGNPEEIEKRYKRGDYKESFAYCFMQPDPPRTEAMKQRSRELLVKHVAQLETSLREVEHQLNTARSMLNDVDMLMNQVLNDTGKSA